MRRGGFTLLEMVVVLAVLGLLMVGLQQGLHFGLTMRQRSDAAQDAMAGLDAADRAIRRLIERIEPAAQGEPPSLLGGPAQLQAITELPASAAKIDTRIRAVLAVDAEHRLVLRWQSWPHARLAAPPPVETTPILPGVDHIVIGYAADSTAQHWLPVWNGTGLPPLIRISLVFPPGDHRQWPDIIAAPKRGVSP